MALIVGWGSSEMNTFIGSSICNVFADFQRSVADRGQLCVCKKLTYKAGNTPDYNDPLVQQYYMLRYFPAYLIEYYLMYTQMLSLNFLPEQLNVLSIGCGCGVDLLGLKFAVKQRKEDPNVRIAYSGVDIAKWGYQNAEGLRNAQFFNGDISQMSSSVPIPNNVIVFPKSISEFPEDIFDNFIQTLANSSFTQDRIVVACSLMTEGSGGDAIRVGRIVTAIVSRGYSANVHWETKGDQWLGEFCPDRQLDYPNAVKAIVDKMAFSCPTYLKNNVNCEPSCAEDLNKQPILRSNFIRYALLCFQR